MLVLTRKVGEKIVVGDVTIILRKVTGSRAVIAIDATDNVRIIRGELIEKPGDCVPTEDGESA